MKKQTRKQVMNRIDKIIADRSKGHLICRTCGEAGCCILAHDNTVPIRKGDKFEKDGEVYAI
jgi:hypothetical protein